MPAPDPSPPQEPRGPPPAISAYPIQNMQNMQYPMPYMRQPISQGGYYRPQQYPSAQHYEHPQRPPMSARGLSSQGPRSFPAPIITQVIDEPSSKYSSARLAPPPTPVKQHHQQSQIRLAYKPKPKFIQASGSKYEDKDKDSDEDAFEGEEEHNEEYDAREEGRRSRQDRALMPPPALRRGQSQKRPSLSQTKTAPAVDRPDRHESRRKSIVVPDPLSARELEQDHPMRLQSVSRPAHQKAQPEYTTAQTRVEVNNSKSNRRQLYQAYEMAQIEYAKARQAEALEEQYRAERQREKRASWAVVQQRHIPGQFNDDDEDEEEDEQPARQVLRAGSTLRKTDAGEERTRKERLPEPKNKRAVTAAEEYIMSTRGSRDPYANSINKATKRKSRMIYERPDSRSSGSGKQSQSNRTTMTSNTANELRLRIDTAQTINVQLSGDMDGRTLQLVPAGDGKTDLVIGSARGEGTVYNSQRGSIMGTSSNSNRRSMIEGQGLRETEEVSERSFRSGRTKRERDETLQEHDDQGQPLRRTRKTSHRGRLNDMGIGTGYHRPTTPRPRPSHLNKDGRTSAESFREPELGAEENGLTSHEGLVIPRLREDTEREARAQKVTTSKQKLKDKGRGILKFPVTYTISEDGTKGGAMHCRAQFMALQGRFDSSASFNLTHGTRATSKIAKKRLDRHQKTV
jgi:hypothetical protein